MAQCRVENVEQLHASDGAVIERHRLRAGPFVVEIGTLGATVLRVDLPGRDGRTSNVVLGHARLQAYEQGRDYFGASVGRLANRLAHGRLRLGAESYQLTCNDGPHHLHGGTLGFDRRPWAVHGSAEGASARIALELRSPDGDQGYPGALHASATYELDPDGELRIEYAATADAPTVVSLTNHAYFNLAGEGWGDVLDHELTIAADRYCVVDESLIPTGELRPVAGTPFDFRAPTPLGRRIQDPDPQLRIAGGYDHCLVLEGAQDATALRHACTLDDPRSGRRLEIRTDRPGVQLYSGNFLDGSVVGPGGRPYRRHGAVCLETQALPDAPNHPHFPSVELRPGERYRARTSWRFAVLP